MRFVGRLTSPALVLSIVALVLAAGGTAWATGALNGHDLTNNSVTHNKMASNAVWHAQIGSKSVQCGNLSADIQQLLKSCGGSGAAGPQGPKGDTGAAGAQGPAGPQGPQGTSGVINPLVYHFSGTSGPDGGECGTPWATDTYDATFIVEPQVASGGAPGGSYTIVKIIDGTFVTRAGASQPNPASCPGTLQTGGVTGTFHGTMSWNVPSPGAGLAPDFDPTAVCGAACSPTTTTTSSNVAQNQAFQAAFFPGSTLTESVNYDLYYRTPANGSWINSNTPMNNTGNIIG